MDREENSEFEKLTEFWIRIMLDQCEEVEKYKAATIPIRQTHTAYIISANGGEFQPNHHFTIFCPFRPLVGPCSTGHTQNFVSKRES